MSSGTVRLDIVGSVARVTFDRPEARNAMTWAMYEQLEAACDRIAAEPALRCAILRGAGGKAFVAGTDIAQFTAFTGAEDGIRYEDAMEPILSKLAGLPVPTLAVVEGWAVGGGLALASLCDLRIATDDARFGLPIARTLGNCLSMRNVARLNALLGPARIKRIVMLAEMLGAEELKACGYLADVASRETLDEKVSALVEKILSHAPLTLRVTKQALLRLEGEMPADRDLIETCYGSNDFKLGVAGFGTKTVPDWTGS
ncbi:enoyl-CoA hydratase/isomerase family protein [Pelagibacterium flavum]|uniref:Enoyl-CoA hydratase/isomerase family protein n=1 Tax=Pelagibacterium flavum TaxID=2984530 RepID=A0ABY6IRS1_9HYPH|nr:enoyl-CoA hydratase/isomerase family protein [Pelagibacterium sp. YIM 151497]UYQ73094.1 enoyl-CoA hydratase/isomerase family protein [Pelagibacterium sp. YIM 151497]